MKNRQSIILWYENVIRTVNKLSFDTFLKTVGAEMSAPGQSNCRPNIYRAYQKKRWRFWKRLIIMFLKTLQIFRSCPWHYPILLHDFVFDVQCLVSILHTLERKCPNSEKCTNCRQIKQSIFFAFVSTCMDGIVVFYNWIKTLHSLRLFCYI